MTLRWKIILTLVVIAIVIPAAMGGTSGDSGQAGELPFWIWVAALLAASFGMGVLAVLGGVGGAVLYVPIVGCFFPFHPDWVRGAGLLVALSGSVAAGPGLLRARLANLRLAMPMALVASASSIVGAHIGFNLPQAAFNIGLGITILGISAVMILVKQSAYPQIESPDWLSRALGINGVYQEGSSGEPISWQIHRTPLGLVIFTFIGVLAGMFGLGAGWANVPALNLLLGAPLKLSVATSKFLISVTDSSAAWVFINHGATFPMIVVPSILGMMLGSMVGVRALRTVNPKVIRPVVLVLLVFAGVQTLWKGCGAFVWNWIGQLWN